MELPARGFIIGLAVAAGVGLALRLLLTFLVAADVPLGGDGVYYHGLANALADGHGFVQPLPLLDGRELPSAEHPPLYPLLLSAVSLLGGEGEASHRVASCLIGSATIPALGMVGRCLAGDRAGLLAAGIAALYPMLVILDGTLYAESLYVLLVALALLVALRARRAPSAGLAAALGALIGLAALTRNEGLVLLGLLALPALWRPRLVRARHIARAAGVCLIVLAPWSAYNWARFDRPVAISTNTGTTIAGANCAKTYADDLIGQWSYSCARAVGGNDAERSAELTNRGVRYAFDHADRLPAVAVARVLRTWDLFRPWNQGAFYGRLVDGRDLTLQRIGLVAYWLLLPLAGVGAYLLRRRRAELLIVAAPALMVTLAAVASAGSTRLRAAAELSVVVLAAVAIDRAMAAGRARSADAERPDIEDRAAVA